MKRKTLYCKKGSPGCNIEHSAEEMERFEEQQLQKKVEQAITEGVVRCAEPIEKGLIEKIKKWSIKRQSLQLFGRDSIGGMEFEEVISIKDLKALVTDYERLATATVEKNDRELLFRILGSVETLKFESGQSYVQDEFGWRCIGHEQGDDPAIDDEINILNKFSNPPELSAALEAQAEKGGISPDKVTY